MDVTSIGTSMDIMGAESKNGLDRSEADSLLHLLRACAWAPPGTNDADSLLSMILLLDLSRCSTNVPRHLAGTAGLYCASLFE